MSLFSVFYFYRLLCASTAILARSYFFVIITMVTISLPWLLLWLTFVTILFEPGVTTKMYFMPLLGDKLNLSYYQLVHMFETVTIMMCLKHVSPHEIDSSRRSDQFFSRFNMVVFGILWKLGWLKFGESTSSQEDSASGFIDTLLPPKSTEDEQNQQTVQIRWVGIMVDEIVRCTVGHSTSKVFVNYFHYI